jgi:hypothetical protein
MALEFQSSEERDMTRFAMLGAAAAISAVTLTAPAMAQEVIYNPGYCAQFYPNANCQNKGPGNPYTGSYQRHVAYGAHDRGPGWHRGWRHSWAAYR